MNAEKLKTHTTVDESLEVFTPYPSYQNLKSVKHNLWIKFFKELISNKH
ncbi:hypothetical protein C8D91_1071 [Marinicella litoralis]|uniref:Uncharacterized protein n=1 Tax=Marinicella litoralis TaxID=644220 RepID=A0A4R6XVJ4_9GAMM|nr:hypothetical protein C8D91_1071 [Marinicella litoralis]